MLSKINLACVGALTLLPHLAFAAGATLPTANVERTCQDQLAATPESKASAFGASPSRSSVQSCVNDERTAFNELRREWARYPTDARVTCATPDGAPISYVELQACLDMQPGGSLDENFGPRERQ
jgi:hypothetical protein